MFKIHSSLGEFNTVQQIGQTPEENPQNTCQKKIRNSSSKTSANANRRSDTNL